MFLYGDRFGDVEDTYELFQATLFNELIESQSLELLIDYELM
jgi:hypothetical protein